MERCRFLRFDGLKFAGVHHAFPVVGKSVVQAVPRPVLNAQEEVLKGLLGIDVEGLTGADQFFRVFATPHEKAG